MSATGIVANPIDAPSCRDMNSGHSRTSFYDRADKAVASRHRHGCSEIVMRATWIWAA